MLWLAVKVKARQGHGGCGCVCAPAQAPAALPRGQWSDSVVIANDLVKEVADAICWKGARLTGLSALNTLCMLVCLVYRQFDRFETTKSEQERNQNHHKENQTRTEASQQH
jgi:hypothetical protein